MHDEGPLWEREREQEREELMERREGEKTGGRK